MSKDWDKELAKIDRQLESISDEALRPANQPARPGAAPVGSPAVRPAPGSPAAAPPGTTTTLGVAFRLLLAAGLGVGMLFWPYKATCGLDLLGYLGAVGLVVVAGGWSAVWSWRHRSAWAHVAALVLVGWGLALAAVEVLPRVGYAQPDPARALWVCE